MRKKIHLLLLFCMSVTYCFSSQIEHSKYVPQGYQLVFSDEFDRAQNKADNWIKHFQDGKVRDWEQFVIDGDGYCRLKNVRVASTTEYPEFTRPSALTKQMFKYGYFECRYKYAQSLGINNSFWLIQNASALDMQALEIDINEGQLDEEGNRQYGSLQQHLKGEDSVRPMILEWSKNGNPLKAAYWYSSSLFGDKNCDLSADFHTYAFKWTPDSMHFYCDGKELLKSANVVAAGPNKNDRWLNYAMPIYLSSYYSYKNPYGLEAVDAEMVVDYVRVYQSNDSQDCGKAPRSGNNLIKNGEFGSMLTNDYTPAHYTGSNQTFYTWVASMGSVKKGYYECSLQEKRTSPLYMPAQFIKPIPAGEYDLKLKAKIEGDQAANITIKLSENASGYVTSIISNAFSISGGGTLSGTTPLIKAAACSDWQEFHYRLTIAEGNPTSSELRFLFNLINSNGAATFAIDDVSLTPVPPSDPSVLLKDSEFDLGLSGYAWKTTFMDYIHSETGVTMTRSVEQENDNKFIRTTISKDHSPDQIYQTNITQNTIYALNNTPYLLSLNARAATPETVGKQFALQLTCDGVTFYDRIEQATEGMSLSTSPDRKYLFFTMNSEEWRPYSAVIYPPNLPTPQVARVYFRFHNRGTFDLDQVTINPYNESSISVIEQKNLPYTLQGCNLTLPENQGFALYDRVGTLVCGGKTTPDRTIQLQHPGLYILQIASQRGCNSYKIVAE